jgi:hypothetical protein
MLHDMMQDMRDAIIAGKFGSWKRAFEDSIGS